MSDEDRGLARVHCVSSWTVFLLAALFYAGCGGRSDYASVETRVPACVPGQQVDCGCGGGRQGTQVCGDDGTYQHCDCSDTGSNSTRSSSFSSTTTGDIATSSSNSSSGSGGANGTGNASGGTGGSASVVEGEQGVELSFSLEETPTFVELFAAEPGIIIVTSESLLLVDRTGRELERIEAPREITAAALDSEWLVVADRGMFRSYNLRLEEVTSGTLAETCASAVLVDGARFVCGPENDWDRVFYTYDVQTGELLATSREYTYKGIPMQRVPGTDDFVTVTIDSSPSDFHLYAVIESGESVFVNESPYHGDFRVTDVYAFDGAPPEHLVTDAGLLLRIYGDNCDAGESSFSSECFVKDGDLGTLTGDQVFLAMGSDVEGEVYGIVDPSPGFSFLDPVCDNGCLLQRIDVESRTIEAQKLIHLDAGRIHRVRKDPATGGFVVAFRRAGDYISHRDPYPGYRVVYFDEI